MSATDAPQPEPSGEPPDAATLEDWIVARVRVLLQEDDTLINVHKPIASYGVDSVEAAGLLADLEDWLGCALPSDQVWEWASAREIAVRLAEHLEGGTRGAVQA